MNDLNPLLSHLVCTRCGAEYPLDPVMNLCPKDQSPVQMVYDTTKLKATNWYQPNRHNMWRFGGLLPQGQKHRTEGEGHTPLLKHESHQLAEQHGFDLWLKDEGKSHPGFGANPTQSFKDRGMAVVANMAVHYGLNRLVVPTQGNAGDSLAHYANKMGLAAAIIMPDDTPMPILGQVAAMARLNPQIELALVKGTIKEAGDLMRASYLPDGYFNVATFQEPGWRIEGKKTMGLELAEPNVMSDDWALPDVIIYPTGGGTGILGMWKAFDELEQMGVISAKRPRIIAVQSKATAPVTQALAKGWSEPKAVTAGQTLATGLNVPGGLGHFKVIEIVKASGGTSVMIEESEIAAMLQQTWQKTGVWICPEGAACLAAIPELIDLNQIKPKDQVVVFNTGSFEKYLPELRHLL